MDENDVAALVLDHFVQALRLADSALDLLDVPEDTTLRQILALKDGLQDLELSMVTLLQIRGITWEAMADAMAVTRQSLHRRLARKSMNYRSSLRSVPVLERELKHVVDLLNQELKDLTGGDYGVRRARRATRIVIGEHSGSGPSTGQIPQPRSSG